MITRHNPAKIWQIDFLMDRYCPLFDSPLAKHPQSHRHPGQRQSVGAGTIVVYKAPGDSPLRKVIVPAKPDHRSLVLKWPPGGLLPAAGPLQESELFPRQQNRWIVAHRGVSDRCPESTRAAFRMAIAQRADAIECDVQLTADNRIVVCHDTRLDRYGHPGVRIRETRLAELQQLDIGRWFDATFSGERMLSLEELLRDFGSAMPLCIELKTDELTAQQCDVLAKELTAQVIAHQLEGRVAILGFHSEALRCIPGLAPWARLILNTHEPERIDEADLFGMPWLNGIDGNIRQLTADVVQMVHAHEMVSMTFTCNSGDDVLKAWDIGVDVIITNDPERTRSILRRHRQYSDAS